MPRPVANPPNPWSSEHVEWIGPPPDAKLEVFEEQAKSIVARNDPAEQDKVAPYRTSSKCGSATLLDPLGGRDGCSPDLGAP